MPKFKSKPTIVEGWLFERSKLSTPENVPSWVSIRLTIIADRYVIKIDDGSAIEVLDGQWLIQLGDGVFPLSLEALAEGFDPVFDETSEVKGNA